jgi:hypothetical protein
MNKGVRARGSAKVRKWKGKNVRRCERRESGKVGKYEGEELGRRW